MNIKKKRSSLIKAVSELKDKQVLKKIEKILQKKPISDSRKARKSSEPLLYVVDLSELAR